MSYFDDSAYFEALGRSPLEADQMIQEHRQQVADERARAQTEVTNSFLERHPEYPQGDQHVATAMTQRVTELTAKGWPFSEDLIELAYYQLYRDGILVVDQSQQGGEQQSDLDAEVAAAMANKRGEGLSDKELTDLLERGWPTHFPSQKRW